MAYVWNLLSCLEKVWCCMRDETFSEHGNEKDRNKEHQDYCNEKNLHWKLNPASTVYDRGCVGWCGVLLLGWERETSFVIKTPVALANGESNRSLTPAEPILCCAGTQIASAEPSRCRSVAVCGERTYPKTGCFGNCSRFAACFLAIKLKDEFWSNNRVVNHIMKRTSGGLTHILDALFYVERRRVVFFY